MNIRPSIINALWMAAGAAMLVAVTLLVLHFRTSGDPAEQLAQKARRVDCVGRMRSALASASEAEKSAVLAVTDHDAQVFADQARAATAEVERDQVQLTGLLQTGGDRREKDLLAEFAEVFTDLRRIDRDVLTLAVHNTNSEATRLAFGLAAAAIREMNAALTRVVEKSAAFPDARNVAILASGSEIAALHMQTLLAPHIAEESDQRMDELEAEIAGDDHRVQGNLGALAAVQELAGDSDLGSAASSYTRFSELRVQILALSRENTHVRSLALSLNQKRKAMFLCQDALDDLEHTILEEPIAGVDYGISSNPRRLRGDSKSAR